MTHIKRLSIDCTSYDEERRAILITNATMVVIDVRVTSKCDTYDDLKP